MLNTEIPELNKLDITRLYSLVKLIWWEVFGLLNVKNKN